MPWRGNVKNMLLFKRIQRASLTENRCSTNYEIYSQKTHSRMAHKLTTVKLIFESSPKKKITFLVNRDYWFRQTEWPIDSNPIYCIGVVNSISMTIINKNSIPTYHFFACSLVVKWLVTLHLGDAWCHRERERERTRKLF